MSAVQEFPKKNEKRDKQVMLQRHYKLRHLFIKCGSYSHSFLVHLTKISKKHPFKRSFTVHITSLSARRLEMMPIEMKKLSRKRSL